MRRRNACGTPRRQAAPQQRLGADELPPVTLVGAERGALVEVDGWRIMEPVFAWRVGDVTGMDSRCKAEDPGRRPH